MAPLRHELALSHVLQALQEVLQALQLLPILQVAAEELRGILDAVLGRLKVSDATDGEGGKEGKGRVRGGEGAGEGRGGAGARRTSTTW